MKVAVRSVVSESDINHLHNEFVATSVNTVTINKWFNSRVSSSKQ